MKSVLISIQPKWCELIASGRKTVEVRKTRPKIDTPFKCYIYKTKKRILRDITHKGEEIYGAWGKTANKTTIISCPDLDGGKVIGEFVCDRISRYGDYDGNTDSPYFITPEELKQTCLTYDEFKKYGKNDILYGWHISELKIYDKPKELGEFRKPCDRFLDCCTCRRIVRDKFMSCNNKITCPPQSWCYVEEL